MPQHYIENLVAASKSKAASIGDLQLFCFDHLCEIATCDTTVKAWHSH